jgi:hypothetical protein
VSDARTKLARWFARRSLSLARGCVTLALIVVACGALVSARAASLADYHARVNAAFTHAGELSAALAADDYGVDEASAARAFAALRGALPPKERVELAGGAVEVDNGWFQKELEAYAAAPDASRRKESATRLRERLGALTRELDADAGASAPARDKEAEKGRLQSILRRPEYNEQAASGSALGRLWEWIKSLLGKLLPKPSRMSPGTAGALSVVARLFVYLLAVALIIFVAWRYGPVLLNQLSTRRRKRRAEEARVVLGERLAPDESAADLIAEAERLARAGDVRAAIRKAYIAVLCELGDRKLIRLAQHKTNRDYLLSVRDRAELYGALRPLTHDFERHWYGFDPASPSDWEQYRALCNAAISE